MADPVYKELSELPVSVSPSLTDILHIKDTVGTDFQITFADLISGYMVGTNNLSDVADIETSRTNLDVFSKEEVSSNFAGKAGFTFEGEVVIDYAGASQHIVGGIGQRAAVYASKAYKSTGVSLGYDGTLDVMSLDLVQGNGDFVQMYTFSEASPVIDFKVTPTVNGEGLVSLGDNPTWTDNHTFNQNIIVQGVATFNGDGIFNINPRSTAPQSTAVDALTRRDFVEAQYLSTVDAVAADASAAQTSADDSESSAVRAETAVALVSAATVSTVPPTPADGNDGDVWWVIE